MPIPVYSSEPSAGSIEEDRLTLIRTLDSISTQIKDIQAENTGFIEELLTLRAELAKAPRQQNLDRGSEALAEALEVLEERLRGYADNVNRLSSHLDEKRAYLRTLRDDLSRTREQFDQSKRPNGTIGRNLDSGLAADLAGLQPGHELCALPAKDSFRPGSDPQVGNRDSIISNPHQQRAREDERAVALGAVSRFDAAHADFLETLRSQRAWRVMLMIRKAYTLWTKGNWKNALRILKVPFEGSHVPDMLAPYDVAFPNIWDYVPASLIRPPAVANGTEIGTAPARRYDVVILPVFDFEFRFQRPQQIAAEFARSGHRVYWVSPTRFENADEGRTSTVPLRENIYEVRLPGSVRNIYTESLTSAEANRLAGCIVDFLKRRDPVESIVLVQFPYWCQVALRLRESTGFHFVYDCMDDWSNWTADPKISAFALQEEQRIAREADLVLATSAELWQRMQASSGRDVLRLRNGADFEFFRDGIPGALLPNIPRPIIGYYGAISDWVDTELMAAAARERPAYSFVIIGEIHDVDVSSLQKLPNVHLLGEKNYRFIPSYLSEFDVAILPFKLNRLTVAVDPVKVYEYLSQGKPVVATRLPEVCDHGDIIYLADEHDFVSQIDRAVNEEKNRAVKRISYASENSWTNRVSVLKRAIEPAYPLVSIIIVSYNSRVYLELLLDSLRRNTTYPRYEVMIVDNASEDGTVGFLQTWVGCLHDLRVFPLAKNIGFAAGNNLAAREARGEYLIFLNADTIVTRGWLERLIRPLHQDESVGMSAPVTNFSGNETCIETTYRNSSELEAFAARLAGEKWGETLEVPMAPFLCVAIKRQIWERVGELDEQFGIGMFEDDDYALRLRVLGYRIVTSEDSFIHHFGNGSFAKLPPEESLALFAKNRSYFEKKSGRLWNPHRMRSGVSLPNASRHSPSAFKGTSASPGEPGLELHLIRLHPESVLVGQPVNRQPKGSSAIVAECAGATPGTVIKFGGELLHTAYGSASLLSAELPPDFNQQPSAIPVTLVNDFGESNPLIFKIEP